MEDSRPPDSQQHSKCSTSRRREHSDERVDKRPADGSSSPTDVKRLIRRVRSPSRPRAWLSSSYKPTFRGRFHRPGDDRFAHQTHHNFTPRGHFTPRGGHFTPRGGHFTPRGGHFRWRGHFQPKGHHMALKKRERGRCEQRRSPEGNSPPKINSAPRLFCRSNRDKDMQFTVCQSVRNPSSNDRDHTARKSKERQRSRDGELPSTASQTEARDRAIQQKRREIDEMYNQECEMFGLVAKMLIAKDPAALEGPIQSALQENLRDIGKRCVDGMESFIEDYDSREAFH